jgi:hypothetical protein
MHLLSGENLLLILLRVSTQKLQCTDEELEPPAQRNNFFLANQRH